MHYTQVMEQIEKEKEQEKKNKEIDRQLKELIDLINSYVKPTKPETVK